jgi:16S rRNA (cytosine967-C5)-methyltransferase
MTASPARRAAFVILRRVELENAYASVLLSALDEHTRDDDRALCHELVFGVLRWQLWLDRTLNHFANRRIEDLDLPVKLALRLGLYQLRFLSRIPASAAVNESVNLVRAAGLKSAASFVNAVLRRATREPDYDPAVGIGDRLEKLAIETSHPAWLIERWCPAFGFEEVGALARANNQAAPVAFRLTVKAIEADGGPERLIEQFELAGVRLSQSKLAPNAWRIAGYGTASGPGSRQSAWGGGCERVGGGKHDTPAELPLREPRAARVPQRRKLALPASKLVRKLSGDGLIYLQDEASQLISHLLAPQSGDRVLDACAAPGSKSTQIASLASTSIIVAGDLFEHRLHTLRELAAIQHAGAVQIVAYDATCVLPFADAQFDRVLVDAPCSGTGTLRRNPEIRWRIKPSDIAEISMKQTRILANAATAVRPGGRLLYSTCSLEPEENEAVAERFLRERKDFRSVQLETSPELRTSSRAVRTWPHRQDVDGFFAAAFQRQS